MEQLREYDIVEVTRDIERYGLRKGDIGTVVHCCEGKLAYVVEFMAGGITTAVVTLSPADVLLYRGGDDID